MNLTAAMARWQAEQHWNTKGKTAEKAHRNAARLTEQLILAKIDRDKTKIPAIKPVALPPKTPSKKAPPTDDAVDQPLLPMSVGDLSDDELVAMFTGPVDEGKKEAVLQRVVKTLCSYMEDPMKWAGLKHHTKMLNLVRFCQPEEGEANPAVTIKDDANNEKTYKLWVNLARGKYGFTKDLSCFQFKDGSILADLPHQDLMNGVLLILGFHTLPGKKWLTNAGGEPNEKARLDPNGKRESAVHFVTANFTAYGFGLNRTQCHNIKDVEKHVRPGKKAEAEICKKRVDAHFEFVYDAMKCLLKKRPDLAPSTDPGTSGTSDNALVNAMDTDDALKVLGDLADLPIDLATTDTAPADAPCAHDPMNTTGVTDAPCAHDPETETNNAPEANPALAPETETETETVTTDTPETAPAPAPETVTDPSTDAPSTDAPSADAPSTHASSTDAPCAHDSMDTTGVGASKRKREESESETETELMEMTVAVLRKKLKARDLNTKGRKVVLVKRLMSKSEK